MKPCRVDKSYALREAAAQHVVHGSPGELFEINISAVSTPEKLMILEISQDVTT
jgi:hypothetical protein